MNEMKPEDVMRALECCTRIYRGDTGSYECSLCKYKEFGEKCDLELIADALALLREKDALIAKHEAYIDNLNDDKAYLVEQLNEKDAEIERLNKEVDRLSQVVLYHDAFANDAIADARAEAINTFANRLKTFYGHLKGKTVGGSVGYHIDQIVKEMGADTCVCCGDVIPEGRQVCPNCERKDDESG